MTRPTILAALALAAAVPALAAGPPQGAAGTYRLATVDGRDLPVTLDEDEGDGCREELSAAVLTLDADGSWTLRSTERDVCGGDVREEEEETEEGSYALEGSALRFDNDGDPGDDGPDDDTVDVDDLASGTVDAGGLTVRTEGGAVLVFRR